MNWHSPGYAAFAAACTDHRMSCSEDAVSCLQWRQWWLVVFPVAEKNKDPSRDKLVAMAVAIGNYSLSFCWLCQSSNHARSTDPTTSTALTDPANSIA